MQLHVVLFGLAWASLGTLAAFLLVCSSIAYARSQHYNVPHAD